MAEASATGREGAAVVKPGRGEGGGAANGSMPPLSLAPSDQASILARLFRSCSQCAPWLQRKRGVGPSSSAERIQENERGDGLSPLAGPLPQTPAHQRPINGPFATRPPTARHPAPVSMASWRKKSLRVLFTLNSHSPLTDRLLQQHLHDAVREHIVEQSMEILKRNDLGGYTVPAAGLYPFQWNWDSAIVAAGWAVFDEPRAWQEIEFLFSGQWKDGMVPSIIFHRPSDSYFPGPEIWGTKDHPSHTTGISQPPVAAMSVRFLYEHAEDKELAEQKLQELFPKLLAWHRWWYKARDPEGRGVVAILHPWESGMDNSPAWDEAMQFPVDPNLPPYQRKDLTHVDAAMRPNKDTYDHYLTLLYKFKHTNFYDSTKLYWVSPFRVTDLCVNCILYRANRDLRWLARCLRKQEVVLEIEGWLDAGYEGFKQLWDDRSGIFKCQDQLTGKLCNARTSAGFLPLFAGMASMEQANRLSSTLETWLEHVPYGVPSCDPRDPRFEALRYWRGPVWIIINWMISNGLKHYGFSDLAKRVKKDSLELTNMGGLLEYFDPETGNGAGGHDFSWTAAMCLAWIDRPAATAIGHKMNGPKKHLDQDKARADSDVALTSKA